MRGPIWVPASPVFPELQAAVKTEGKLQNGWIRQASEVYPGSILYRPATAKEQGQ